MRCPKERETTSVWRIDPGSPSGTAETPRSSSAVFQSVTEKRRRIQASSARARSKAVRMPAALSRAATRLPTPQTSSTGLSLRSRVQSSSPGRICHSPRPLFLAAWLASLARVLVEEMPMETGIPVQRSTRSLASDASSAALAASAPVSRQKASSMEYWRTSWHRVSSVWMTLAERSP